MRVWLTYCCFVMSFPLCGNAGVQADNLVEQLLKSVGNYGYNAKTRRFADLREEGVLDAASVVKSSLRAAVSIASMVILTEVLYADL